MTLLKIIATIICIVLVVLLLTKFLVRIVWFLFPYSDISLKLRSHLTAQYVARHLNIGSEQVKNNFGRTYVSLPRKYSFGLSDRDFVEDYFTLVASAIATCGDFSKGAAMWQDDDVVFQFWQN